MNRPRCDQTEDDGSNCPSWAIDGYDRCVRHWQPGIGPQRLHAPAYSGLYAQSYKLDRPVQEEPAEAAAARPYPVTIREEPAAEPLTVEGESVPPSRRGLRRFFDRAA
ncbi:hypothetical protein ACFXPA_38140 [Amycolatopsis sp. NPDC059090]|uniref:hypothetical protein n=1 Tax=Amycolatopsis sp. NPDC059090 TaxID=3346723 RepID=UPI00366FE17C